MVNMLYFMLVCLLEYSKVLYLNEWMIFIPLCIWEVS